MPELRLQDYVTKIKGLIQSERADEAIAHCQHILRHHTKHIETYCLLGEACLEKGAWREAIEFFQRTLSADPESFIARIGLGVIYGEQGALPNAIWQMERAFELAPGNAEVRRQLQHLYNQRDGGEKARLRLTQGALGRLYSRNGLYERAIGEFRAILDQDPDLPDVQIALAEALWLEGRRLEAVETCLDLVDVLPHCLKANLILGEVWTRGEHREAGEERLQLAQTLDPENRLAQQMMGEESPLPRREVLIPKLEVVPEELVPVVGGTPFEAELAWLEGEDQAENDLEEIPDWMEARFAMPEKGLAPEGEGMQPSEEGEPPAREEPPAWLIQLMGESPTAPIEPEEMLQEEAGMLETVEPAVGEPTREEAIAELPGESVLDRMPDLKAPADAVVEEVLAPQEEVPDSLRALVDAGILDESDLVTAMAEMSEEDLATQQAEEVPEWLRDLIGEEAVAETLAAEPLAETWEEEAIVPPVQESTLQPEAEELEEIPEWLKDLGIPPAEPPAATELPADAVESEAEPEEIVAAVEEVEEAPEEAVDEQVTLEEATAEVELPLDVEVEILPEWLKEMGMPAAEPAAAAEEESVVPEEVAPEEAVPPEADVEELPRWLQEIEVPATEPPVAREEEVALPLEQPEAPAAEEEVTLAPQEEVPDSLWALVEAGILDESDVASAMAEMSAEDLATQQAEEVPEWLRDLVGEEDLGPEIIPAPASEEEAVSPPQAEEVPDWLREAVVVPEEEAPAPAEIAPEVEVPAVEEPILEPPTAARAPEEAVQAEEEAPAPEVAPEVEVRALEESILEPPTAARAPEETVQAEEEALVLEAEEEQEAPEPEAEEELREEAPVQESKGVEAPSIPVAEVEAPEVEAAPPVGREMVAPYDRVEIEEDLPVLGRIDDLEQRLKANPRDFPLRLELARLYREERDWDAALKHYQKLISARTFLPAILDDLDLMLKTEVAPVRIYQLMGDAYMQENALDRALEMYRLAQQSLTKR